MLALVLAAGLPAGGGASEPLDRGVRAPGVVETFTIEGGQQHAHRLTLDPKHRYRVVVVEDGVELSIRAGSDGAEHDTRLHGVGRETLAIAPGVTRVTLRAVEIGAKGAYSIELQRLDTGGPRAIEAQRLTDAASRLAALEKDEAARLAAAEGFAKAARAWAAAKSADDRAHNLLAQCALERRAGKRVEAIAHCEQARDVWRALGAERDAARASGRLGLLYTEVGRSVEAAEAHTAALNAFERIGDQQGRANAILNLGLLLHYQGDLDAALGHYRTAIEIYERLEQRGALGNLHNNLGGIHFMRGEAQAAKAEFAQSIRMQREVGNLEGEASALGNLALLQRDLGELRSALEAQTSVLAIRRELVDREGEARTLQNIGLVYLNLGDPERAREFLEQALKLRREVADRVGEIATLRNLALAAAALDDYAAALAHLDDSERLAKQADLREPVAAARAARGEVLLLAGDPQRARAEFAAAATTFDALGTRRKQAEAILGEGRALLATGAAEQAGASAHRALAALGDAAYLPLQARAHLVVAQSAQAVGRNADAAEAVARALALIESVRGSIGTPELRAGYGSTVRDAYELAVELAMTGASADITKGFELAEWIRARSFNEMLGEPDLVRSSGGGSKAHALRQRFDELDAELTARAASAREGWATADAVRVRAELDVVEAELRRTDPAFADLRAPRRLAATELRALLDRDTVLLEYLVGERGSYLWVATRDGLRFYALPPRAELDRLVRRVTDGWSRRVQGEDVDADARRLATLLLPPGALDGAPRRLAIVADGPLEYLPFAALPLGTKKRLIQAHEIVMLPSASALATQRKALADRARAPHALALVADPVFDRADSRAPSCTTPRCDPAPGPQLPRLAGTSAEARAILELTGTDDGFRAIGAAATKAVITAGALAGHRTVHIATHGLLDARQPLRTGLMLSRIGADGAVIDGFLGLRDIAALRLDADLVVLSACETALGREIRGEGLVGLTRGFMHAGARSVLATLWRVSDAGSGEAMRRFYAARVRDGLSASAALRRAQLELLSDKRYADPYHWSAYTLHGDWRD